MREAKGARGVPERPESTMPELEEISVLPKRSRDLSTPQENLFERIPKENERMSVMNPEVSFEDGTETCVVQGSVSFQEVAVHFAEEEWVLLDSSQRVLHREVMMENSRNLATLAEFVQENEDYKESNEVPIQAFYEVEKVMFGNEKVPEKNEKSSTKHEDGKYCPDGRNDVHELPILQGHKGKSKVTYSGNEQTGNNQPNLSQHYSLINLSFFFNLHQQLEMNCGENCPLSSQLPSQKGVHPGEELFKCLECGKGVSRQISLVTHEGIRPGEKPFKCTECGNKLTKSKHFTQHEKTHTGEMPYICLECGKSFRHRGYLRKHARSHTGKNPLKFTESGKSFTDNCTLGHASIHSQEKPYKCIVCGKSFRRNDHLVIHQRIHTGEKPFKCTECEKCFSNNGNFHRHKRTHSKEKPYQCILCGKSFSLKGYLVRHTRIHTGEKPFKCNECGRSFSDNRTLLHHKIAHTREKP